MIAPKFLYRPIFFKSFVYKGLNMKGICIKKKW